MVGKNTKVKNAEDVHDDDEVQKTITNFRIVFTMAGNAWVLVSSDVAG
jgi:hypothetical protein